MVRKRSARRFRWSHSRAPKALQRACRDENPAIDQARGGSYFPNPSSKWTPSSAVEPGAFSASIPAISDLPNRSNEQLWTKICPSAQLERWSFCFFPPNEPFDNRWNRNRKLAREERIGKITRNRRNQTFKRPLSKFETRRNTSKRLEDRHSKFTRARATVEMAIKIPRPHCRKRRDVGNDTLNVAVRR